MKKIDDVLISELDYFVSPDAYLVPISNGKDLTWDIKRSFFIEGRKGVTRGNHAHKICSQGIVCISGEIIVTCKDGVNEKNFILNTPKQLMKVPAGIWLEIKFLQDSIMLVFASEKFDELEYLRDWRKFIEFRDLN